MAGHLRGATVATWLAAALLFAPLALAAAASATPKKESLASCRADYPELLARVNAELAPWSDTGITREMLDVLWRCDDGDPAKAMDPHLSEARKFVGLRGLLHNGTM
jgi:hypothetical protein